MICMDIKYYIVNRNCKNGIIFMLVLAWLVPFVLGHVFSEKNLEECAACDVCFLSVWGHAN